jgi:uncharacterized protein YndB with AHSA1/START domain
MSAEYVFRSQWRLPAPAAAVYEALRDVESYPQWWPQVVAVRRLEDAGGELRCRSLLPYDLVFTVHREIEDAASGVLRAALTGDLAGTSQWTVRDTGTARGTGAGTGTGSVAVFDEEVDVHKGLVRAAGRLVRPALRFNHDLMMRAGEKGLRRHLSGR